MAFSIELTLVFSAGLPGVVLDGPEQHTISIVSAMTGGDRQKARLCCMKYVIGIRTQVCGQKNNTATVAVTVQGKSFEYISVCNCSFFNL